MPCLHVLLCDLGTEFTLESVMSVIDIDKSILNLYHYIALI